tara:strand:+ start:3835 stop:6234 length:2400 start_codon:yes stop_codon:yes gene_type:complete
VPGLAAGAFAASFEESPGWISPSQWPSVVLNPKIDGWPNAARIWGPDRYQTALSGVLSLRGSGGFPYETPDPSSAGAQDLGSADQWWGTGRCPKSFIVVAGDVTADALAATALSDPAGLSSEPYLRRSASADPLFDPIGGYSRVNTDFAPIIVTASNRDGSVSLTNAARLAAKDLSSGGCEARQAIIVGGPAAVPAGVDEELISIGVDEVFRVFGATRYSSAASVAVALQTFPVPDGISECADKSVVDGTAQMGFYANSVVEWRPGPNECHLLGKTVVIADGLTGVDALAAGWWTSYWQVPVLLHNRSGSLPDETAAALELLDVSNLLILGGSSRINDNVVEQAVAITGAVPYRIAGRDRYETSIAMAKHLGGWWPSGRAMEYEGSILCFAGSSGVKRETVGWADTLAAGAWCGNATYSASNLTAPDRALGPINGRMPMIAEYKERRGRDAVPIILIPAGRSELPDSVFRFLTEAYEPADYWCSSVSSGEGCALPGYAVVFGGPNVVPESVISRISALVSGGSSTSQPPPTLTLRDAFSSELSMAPLFHESGQGVLKMCALRSGYTDARWLAVTRDRDPHVTDYFDVMLAGWHLADADGTVRGSASSAPGCFGIERGDEKIVSLKSVGIDGRTSQLVHYGTDLTRRTALTGPIVHNNPIAVSGMDTDFDPTWGGETTMSFLDLSPFVGMAAEGLMTSVGSAGVTLVLRRGRNLVNDEPDTFSATWTVETSAGSLYGSAEGEARLVGASWLFRGRSQIDGGTLPYSGGIGGFSADLSLNQQGMGDDTLHWRFDAAAGPDH